MKRISLVITSYNQKDLLAEALDSALAQTLRPFEIVVADDCSTDGSQQLIDQYAREHPSLIKPIYHRSNLGISRNRNSGLLAARGDLVTWLDGDDRLCPRKLEMEQAILEQQPGVAWVYSQVRIIDKAGNFEGLRFDSPPQGNIFEPLLGMLGSAPRSLMVRRNIFERIGYFDEDMTLYEDYDLCLRLAREYECGYCSEALSEYRVHPSGLHNSDYHAYMQNLSRLVEHLNEMLAGYPETERDRLRSLLLSRADYLILQTASRRGDVSVIRQHWLHIARRSPKQGMDPGNLRFLARAVLRRLAHRRSPNVPATTKSQMQ